MLLGFGFIILFVTLGFVGGLLGNLLVQFIAGERNNHPIRNYVETPNAGGQYGAGVRFVAAIAILYYFLDI